MSMDRTARQSRIATTTAHNEPAGKQVSGEKARPAPLARALGNQAVLQILQTSPVPDQLLPAVNGVVGSPGEPLDTSVRRAMEPLFQRNFDDVRVHTNSAAGASTHAILADAYTVGNHIAFGTGRYAPGSTTGQRLIAHELAHVVQQAGGGDSSGALHEAQAEAAAGSVLSGLPATSLTPAAVGVQRSGYGLDDLRKDLDHANTYLAMVGGGGGLIGQQVGKSIGDSIAPSAKEAYNKIDAKAGELADSARAAWDKTDTKKFVVKATQGATPEEDAAGAVEKQLDAGDKTTPQGKLARSAGSILKAAKKLQAAPKRAGMKALLDGHPVQAVKDWQKASDEGLKDLKDATFSAINDWEKGEFEQSTKASIDPAAHPTLASVEGGVISATNEIGKRKRQFTGGALKAGYTMAEGIENIVVHPVNTVEGLAKLGDMTGTAPSFDTLKQGADFRKDLFDPKLSVKEAFTNLVDGEQKKNAARTEQTGELLKGVGHNYVEAAGGEFVPPVAEQTEEQKARFADKKPGEINWEGSSDRERYAEIPGMLMVDVGSFFLGGGEAKAAAKTGEAAEVVGEGSKLAEGLGDVSKSTDGAGNVVKSTGDAADFGKPVHAEPPLPSPAEAELPPAPAAETKALPELDAPAPVEPLEKMPEFDKSAAVPPLEKKAIELPPAPREPPLTPPRKITSARGPRYDTRVSEALEKMEVGAETSATPLREPAHLRPAKPSAPNLTAEPLPDNLRDIRTGERIDPFERMNPAEANAETMLQDLESELAEAPSQPAVVEYQAAANGGAPPMASAAGGPPIRVVRPEPPSPNISNPVRPRPIGEPPIGRGPTEISPHVAPEGPFIEPPGVDKGPFNKEIYAAEDLGELRDINRSPSEIAQGRQIYGRSMGDISVGPEGAKRSLADVWAQAEGDRPAATKHIASAEANLAKAEDQIARASDLRLQAQGARDAGDLRRAKNLERQAQKAEERAETFQKRAKEHGDAAYDSVSDKFRTLINKDSDFKKLFEDAGMDFEMDPKKPGETKNAPHYETPGRRSSKQKFTLEHGERRSDNPPRSIDPTNLTPSLSQENSILNEGIRRAPDYFKFKPQPRYSLPSAGAGRGIDAAGRTQKAIASYERFIRENSASSNPAVLRAVEYARERLSILKPSTS